MANQADFKIKKGLQVGGGDVNLGNAQDGEIQVDAITGAGTNIAGRNLVLSAGEGKGSSAGGTLTLKTAATTAVGSALLLAADKSATFYGAVSGVTTLSTTDKLTLDKANANSAPGADGHLLHIDAVALTDATTSSGTVAAFNAVTIDAPTLLASNSNITTTTASTLYIGGAPAQGSNQTLTNSYALNIAAGGATITGGATIAGGLSLNDENITNVGAISLDTIAADDSAIVLKGADSTAAMFNLTNATGNSYYKVNTDTPLNLFGYNVQVGTPGTKITIGSGEEVDTMLVLDGAETDYRISLNDATTNANTLEIGVGTTVNANVGYRMDGSGYLLTLGADSPSAGDVLVYTTGSPTRWKPAAPSSAAISTSANSGTDNTILYYNGTGHTSVQSSNNLVFDDTDLKIAAAGKVQLRDTAIFINSSTDGQMDLDADAKIEFNTPVVDFISTGQNRPVWGLTNNYDDTGGPTMEFKNLKGSASNAGDANDILGHITFGGRDTANAEAGYGSIKVEIDVPTAGSESGTMRIGVATGDSGTVKDIIVITGDDGAASASTTTIKGDLTVEGTTTTVNSTEIDVTNALVFDGSTAGGDKTTLSVTDPTDARTITLPDADGTVTVAGGAGLTLTSAGSMSVDAAQTQITSVGTLATGAVSSGFGNIDNGTSTLNSGATTVTSLTSSGGVTGEALYVEGTGLSAGEGVKFEARHTAFSSVGTGTATEIYSWVASNYRSGKFLIQMSTGTETEISEVLVTNQNIGAANTMATGDFYYTVYGALDTGTALMGALTFTVVSGSGVDTVTMKMNPLATFTGTVKVLATLVWED